jgi:hypothetical protein
MANPDRLPMPVWIVASHPMMQVAGQVLYGAVACLTMAYWLGDCRPLPSTYLDLAAVARVSPPTWAKHGEAIKAALAEILPLLSTARERELAVRLTKRDLAKRAYDRRKLRGEPQPHHSPRHISKTRKARGASDAEQAAQAAMEAAGIADRRVAASELVAGHVASGLARVALPASAQSRVIPASGVASTEARRGLVDTARPPR